MSKQYSPASKDLEDRIARIVRRWHPDLEGVTIQALFVFTDEPGCALKHQGYPAAAVAKIVGTKERAAGMADALIVVDRYTYSGFTEARRDALIDHELQHLTRALDDEGRPKSDVLGRPKLEMRLHDHQLGWFDEIANRHGDASLEVAQARELIQASGQIYFDFGDPGDDDADEAEELQEAASA